MIGKSRALISVWHVLGSSGNGPTFSSLVGIVRLKGTLSTEMNVISIVAVRDEIREHAIPYVPTSAGKGLISGEIAA